MLAELNNNVIGIIVAIIVTIIASLVKKKQPDEEWELPPELKPRRDQPPQSPQPPKVSRWEEELRRVLQEQPAPPPIVRPAVPPPLIHQMEEYQPSPDEGFSEEPVVPRRAALTEAAESHAHAATLLQRTQEQLHQLHSSTHRAARPATVHHVEVAPEIRALVNSLRQPQTARAAILASVILGPPRAFET
jgi:hypothetical protein